MNYLKGTAAVVLLWYLLAALVSAPIVPFPHRAAARLAVSLTGEASYLHMLFSLYRMAGGMVLALLLGIPVGMLAGRLRSLDQVISPVLYLLYPVPKIAFLPVFMVLLGIGDVSKIALIASIIFFPIAVSIKDGVREISLEYAELASAFHLTPREMIRDILFPGVLPRIFTSLRITLGISLSVLFISENYAASYGLGYAVMNHWIMADYTGMYAFIILLSTLGFGLYLLIDLLERVCLPWKS